MLHAISQSGSEVWAIHPKTRGNMCLIVEVVASIVGESGEKKARAKIHEAGSFGQNPRGFSGILLYSGKAVL